MDLFGKNEREGKTMEKSKHMIFDIITALLIIGFLAIVVIKDVKTTELPTKEWECTGYNQVRYVDQFIFEQQDCEFMGSEELAGKVGLANDSRIQTEERGIICHNGSAEKTFIWKPGQTCVQYTMKQYWQKDKPFGTQWG